MPSVRSTESGDVWYKSRQLKRATCVWQMPSVQGRERVRRLPRRRLRHHSGHPRPPHKCSGDTTPCKVTPVILHPLFRQIFAEQGPKRGACWSRWTCEGTASGRAARSANAPTATALSTPRRPPGPRRSSTTAKCAPAGPRTRGTKLSNLTSLS